MKTRILILFMLISYLKSMSQATVIEPGKSTVKALGSASELDITNYGGQAGITGSRVNGTYAAPSNILLGNNLFEIKAGGYVPTLGFRDAAQISFIASENWNNTSSGSDIQFSTTKNGSFFRKPVLTIKNSGYIGIGTTNPRSTLHVVSGASQIPVDFFSNCIIENDFNTSLTLASPIGNSSSIQFGQGGYTAGARVSYNGDSTLSIESGRANITLNPNGNVVIGTPFEALLNPVAKLTVDGDFAISRNIYVNNNIVHNNFNRNKSSVISSQLAPANLSSIETFTGFTGGSQGIFLYLYPRQGTSIILKHNDSGSLPENRIHTNSGSDITLVDNGGVTLIYDEVASKWRVISIAN